MRLSFKIITPPRMVLFSFGACILLGAVILYLPVMQGPNPVTLVDCLFTATSAVCVTGLITVDTASAWSIWGQICILLMIQVGGLGIMTISVAMLTLTGRRAGLRSNIALQNLLGSTPIHAVGHMARSVVIYTLGIEAVGAAILLWGFLPGHEWPRALYLAVFHSVSAFCNAGFALFADNLESYNHSLLVNLTVMGLIFLGGIGFLVLREIKIHLTQRRGPRPERFSTNSRMALYTSAVLILAGGAVVWCLEYFSNGGLAWQDSWTAPFFLSVTARTAGFDTVSMDSLSNASLLVVMIMMFVGASPASCGGGVKTTTWAVLFTLIKGRLRGRTWVEFGKRRIAESQVTGAMALVLGSFTIIIIAILLLLSLDVHDSAFGHARQDILRLAFEAVSAFGTVGLSLGATPGFNPVGKLILILLMFIGRLGPVTFMYSLVQNQYAPNYLPAEEPVLLG